MGTDVQGQELLLLLPTWLRQGCGVPALTETPSSRVVRRT